MHCKADGSNNDFVQHRYPVVFVGERERTLVPTDRLIDLHYLPFQIGVLQKSGEHPLGAWVRVGWIHEKGAWG